MKSNIAHPMDKIIISFLFYYLSGFSQEQNTKPITSDKLKKTQKLVMNMQHKSVSGFSQEATRKSIAT